tara:strand:- start:113 stop:343 length:231 start_codon:yes stop_codon:yes gene_type:complete
MIPLLNREQARSLHIKAPWHNNEWTESLMESGLAKFADQTIDVSFDEGIVRRLTFGRNVIVGRVALCSEVLRKDGI